MLRELLCRDLRLHHRVLLLAAALPVLMSLGTLAGLRSGMADAAAVLSLAPGLFLVLLLPQSLQLREQTLGTLGDLLALPVARRDLVRLRFAEGLLGALAFLLLHLGFWCLLLPGSAWRLTWDVVRSPFPAWVALVALAYPMPFALRWGGRGLASAAVLLMGLFWGWALLQAYGPQVPALVPLLEGQAWLAAQARGSAAARVFLERLLPLALGFAFYLLSVRAFEGRDV